MRVLYFYRDDTVHDRRFMDAFAKQPVEVIALRLESRSRAMNGWKPPRNVHQISWSMSDRPFRWSYRKVLIDELKRIICKNNPNVIHAGPIDLCGYLAARSGFRPLVSMSWGYDLLVNAEKSILSRNRIRYALERTAILLGDCKTVTDKASHYGFPVARNITFPWGIDLKIFRPGSGQKVRNKFGWANNIILLSTRSMEKIYGCDVLVDAFISAAHADARLCLLMLGDGSQKKRLMQRISSARLNSRTIFTGFIPENEIVQYFRSSDIYISASHSDGSSVSLLQAMACGISPLVSNIPGNREWVTPHQNGWLFEDGNSASLTDLICQVGCSPTLRTRYGEVSRAIVQKRADWRKNSQKLSDVYQQAVNYQLGQMEGHAH